jgi:hypothetical protein
VESFGERAYSPQDIPVQRIEKENGLSSTTPTCGKQISIQEDLRNHLPLRAQSGKQRSRGISQVFHWGFEHVERINREYFHSTVSPPLDTTFFYIPVLCDPKAASRL